MTTFYEHIMSESETIFKILDQNNPMLPLTTEEQTDYDNSVICPYCTEPYSEGNYKVMHHNHADSRFISPSCNSCNLQLKPVKAKPKQVKKSKKRSRATDNDGYNEEEAEESYKSEYFLPIVFHNLKSYDAHFVIKHFQRKYTENVGEGGKITIDDITVIPLNTQKYLMFEVGKVRFLDSFQFLSTSLSNLTEMLLKSGKENFVYTTKYFGEDDLLYAKGVYPYSYMDSRDRFAETKLPDQADFYNTLTEECLSDEDYQRAQAAWKRFDIRDMEQYHNHYLKLDVLLLTDVFEYFRRTMYAQHKLDCLHYYTLPSLSWSAALKHTKAKIELLTDPDAYLMIESAMRGGISQISCRRADANNKYMGEDIHKQTEETSYLTYLDSNNLYGKSMSMLLPTGNFRFLKPEEIEKFNVADISADSERGYIIECDLHYPSELHDMHNDYPLAPEHMTITHDMLSEYARSFDGKLPKPTKKLILNLRDKTMYVTHYRNLQFYIAHGLKLTKIHRVLEFTQSAWLKPFIDLCTQQRQNATTQFESDFHKATANSCFGKSMENLRGRQNIRLIADPDKATKAVSKPTYVQSEIINEDLVMVKASRLRTLLNKPIFTGFAILELSKLVMYEFHYDYILPKYGPVNAQLLFTDTDSLTYLLKTDDLYDDMEQNLDLFDTSNFDADHRLYSLANKRVVGKFKSETGNRAPKQFIGLKAKMYSLDVGKNECKMALKGISKSYAKKHVRHRAFVETLEQKTCTFAKYRSFRSTNHVLQTLDINKVCLNAWDDKRYILPDGIHSYAYGHKDIPLSQA